MANLALAVVCVLVVGCASDGAEDGRTYYESLDLRTPEAAAETVIEAFQASDFMTVWLTFHPGTQLTVKQARGLLLFDQLIDPAGLDLRRELRAVEDLDRRETDDTWWYFDQLMMTAAGHDAFLIDLRGDVELGNPVTGPDGSVDVPADVEGIDGTVTIRMEERNERFRIVQVIVPGGSEELVPWSVRPAGT